MFLTVLQVMQNSGLVEGEQREGASNLLRKIGGRIYLERWIIEPFLEEYEMAEGKIDFYFAWTELKGIKRGLDRASKLEIYELRTLLKRLSSDINSFLISSFEFGDEFNKASYKLIRFLAMKKTIAEALRKKNIMNLLLNEDIAIKVEIDQSKSYPKADAVKKTEANCTYIERCRIWNYNFEDDLKKIILLATILSRSNDKVAENFIIPECTSIVVEEDVTRIPESIRVNFDLKLPVDNYQGDRSLQSVLNVNYFGADPTEYKYQLAYSIAYSLFAIHSVGIAHRKVRPKSIILVDDKTGQGILKRNGDDAHGSQHAYLLGFIQSVSSIDNDDERLPSFLPERLYFSPDRSTEIVAHKIIDDIFALGVCLLQIGLWKPIKKAMKFSEDELVEFELHNSGLDFLERMLTLARENLSQEMNTIYSTAVLNCLNVYKNNDAIKDLEKHESDILSDLRALANK